jgi:hypothetical protein
VREVQALDIHDTLVMADHRCSAQRRTEDAWSAEGCPLLDDEPPRDERALVVRWLRKEARVYRKQMGWRSLDTDSIVSGESAAEALEDVADEIERGEHAKEQS